VTSQGRPRPKKSLGQNFLVDPNLQRKIVRAVGAGPRDEVLEIGPGRGALTRHLVGSVGHLVLVELDDELAGSLQAEFGARQDVDVIRGDVLEVPWRDRVHDPGRLRVVGNIPYSITTPILFALLERPRPQEIVLMVQEEVAARLVAGPGTGEYGALTVGVQAVAGVERLFRVGRAAFRPVPRVDSAVVRIRPYRPEPLGPEEEVSLRRLVRAAFQWRRKQLSRILRDHPDLRFGVETSGRAAQDLGIDLESRPERLPPAMFVALARRLLG
jgi:16S rRNA (adenine1518-N6/adenine1519-N6)-dimethyltransferase